MSGKGENPFWDFSLAVYARKGVAPACLRLQDAHGADVNVLLYCCWIAREHGIALDDGSLARVLAHVAPWKDSVVVPLRAVRHALRDDFPGFDAGARDAFRTTIKRIELEAERLQQDALLAALPPGDTGNGGPRGPPAPVGANVSLYLRHLGAGGSEAARLDAEIVIAAATARRTA